MKIIEALKRMKHLDRKIGQNTIKITNWSSYLSNELQEGEEPLYNTEDVRRLQQSVVDMSMEKLRLRHLIHATNAMTKVTYNGKEMTVDELIMLKEIVHPARLNVWSCCRKKSVPLHNAQQPVKVIMQYNGREKERELDDIQQELEVIENLLDKITLEVDLVE